MPDEKTREPLVKVEGLCKYFQITKRDTLKAVDDISFVVYKGETLGVVGESGCGKSTMGRCLVRLYNPTAGKITYDGTDINTLKTREDQLKYCKKVQMIFQNPYSSLNPRMTVLDTVGEGIRLYHKEYTHEQVVETVVQLLEKVGLGRDHLSRFMHEFSGGQKQRIGIARALSVDPEFIVCDEPISALDVSIQAQVVNMLKDLQKEMGLTYLCYRPRSVHGEVHLRPHRGDVSGLRDGDLRFATRLVQAPAASLHAGACSPPFRSRIRSGPSRPRISSRARFPAPSTPSPTASLQAAARSQPICRQSIPSAGDRARAHGGLPLPQNAGGRDYSMKIQHTFQTIDTHTGGEPTRTVVRGFPHVPGKTMKEKMVYMMENGDWMRQLLCYEPRGNDVMSGTLLTEPCSPEADIGVLYFEVGNWMPMCGHDTIGVATALWWRPVW
jgi:ABC-type dipeptide/oligopeptide/nickel transport system ATPase subunit